MRVFASLRPSFSFLFVGGKEGGGGGGEGEEKGTCLGRDGVDSA